MEVNLVAIGATLPLDALVEALGSDIPEGLHLSAARGEVFDESTFLAQHLGGPRSIDVWVDASQGKEVRLYFSDAQNSRYALRKLELSGVMNEIDLEILAQAIAWSLRAFVDGAAETLSREEIESRLTPPSPARHTVDKPLSASNSWFSAKRAVFTDLRLFYRLSLYSPQIPFVHGPGLGAGIVRTHGKRSWGLDASVQYQLPASYEKEGVSLKLTSFAPRVHLQLIAPLSERVALGAQLGGGVDFIWASSRALDEQKYVARAPSTSVAIPVATGALAQFKLSPHVVFHVEAGLELYVWAPRFELANADGFQSLVASFPLRPTITLALGAL